MKSLSPTDGTTGFLTGQSGKAIRVLLSRTKIAGQRFVRGIKYSGNSVHCNVCDRHFRKFMSAGVDAEVLTRCDVVGGGFRDNALCPYCLAAERTRLICRYLKEIFGVHTNDKPLCLHIAPEWPLVKQIKKQLNIKVITGDLYSPYVDKIIDVTSINEPDNTYDIVICSHVLEHIPDDKTAIAELYRVLKPGGRAILQVPISLTLETTIENLPSDSREQRLENYGQVDHVRLYGQDYKHRLESCGFQVEKYLPDADALAKLSLNSKEFLYVGCKNQV